MLKSTKRSHVFIHNKKKTDILFLFFYLTAVRGLGVYINRYIHFLIYFQYIMYQRSTHLIVESDEKTDER